MSNSMHSSYISLYSEQDREKKDDFCRGTESFDLVFLNLEVFTSIFCSDLWFISWL